MRLVLLLLLWVIVLWQVARAIKDTNRIYEYPFLITFGIAVFILPTATMIVERSGLVSDFAYQLMLGNTLLCYITSLVAYHFYKPNPPKSKKQYDLNADKLFKSSIPFVLIGVLSALYLSRIDVDEGWYGLPVYVLFFARFLRPALVILLASLLLKRTPQRMIIFLVSLAFPLNAVLVGRRFELAILVLLLTCTYHLIKKWSPPRMTAPLVILASTFLLIIIPIVRSNTFSENITFLQQRNFAHHIDKSLTGKSTNEFVESCYDIEAYYKSNQYGLGKSFWNSLVKQYIPRGLVGQEAKDNFYLDAPEPSEIRTEFSPQSARKSYLTPIGFTSAFFEFRYFSFLFYIIFAVLAKHLYTRANELRTLPYITFYSMFSILCIMASYDSISFLHTFFVPYLIVWGTAYLYSRTTARSKKRYFLFWQPAESETIQNKPEESQSTS